VQHSSPSFKIDPSLAQRVPLKILLAEDNPVNQKVLLSLLRRMGYEADVANHGLEVLEALRDRIYDVVLMDVHMPEMDGLTATRQICQEWQPADRPRIIAMTAGAMESDRLACLEAGMDDYLSKPLPIDKLVQILQQCQPRATQTAALDAAPDMEILKELYGRQSSEDSLSEIIDLYLEDAAHSIQIIRQACIQGDRQTCQRVSHTLQASSAAVGAKLLPQLCRTIEITAKNHAAGVDLELVAQLETEYERVKAALQLACQSLL
jgi:CheY-like chemotaxis protein/HPt (histidine-containing phosphotransfer) domain-containing protein